LGAFSGIIGQLLSATAVRKLFPSSRVSVFPMFNPFQLFGSVFQFAAGTIANQQQVMDNLCREVLTVLNNDEDLLRRLGKGVSPHGSTSFSQTIVNGQSRIKAEFGVIGSKMVPVMVCVHAAESPSAPADDENMLQLHSIQVLFPNTNELFDLTHKINERNRRSKRKVIDATFQVKK